MIEAKMLRLVGSVCPDAARIEEFNEWYDKVHIPEVLERIPGAKTAARYVVHDPEPGAPQFVALYEIEGAAVDTFDRYIESIARGEAPPWTWGPPIEIVWHANLPRMEDSENLGNG